MTGIASRQLPWVIAALMLALLTGFPADGGKARPPQYEVKAKFLLGFAEYVDWPATAFSDTNSPICIGVLGDAPSDAELEKAVHDQGNTINNRKVTIKRSRRVEDLKTCHLVFISKSEEGRLADILASFRPTSVLTVSEVDGFCRSGGVINFFLKESLEESKVRFEINPAAAQRHGLKISSHLLKLGRIVGPERGKEP